MARCLKAGLASTGKEITCEAIVYTTVLDSNTGSSTSSTSVQKLQQAGSLVWQVTQVRRQQAAQVALLCGMLRGCSTMLLRVQHGHLQRLQAAALRIEQECRLAWRSWAHKKGSVRLTHATGSRAESKELYNTGYVA